MYFLIFLRNSIGWKKWKYNDDYNDIDNKNVCNDYDGDDDQSDNDDDDDDDVMMISE